MSRNDTKAGYIWKEPSCGDCIKINILRWRDYMDINILYKEITLLEIYYVEEIIWIQIYYVRGIVIIEIY